MSQVRLSAASCMQHFCKGNETARGPDLVMPSESKVCVKVPVHEGVAETEFFPLPWESSLLNCWQQHHSLCLRRLLRSAGITTDQL